MNKESVIDNLKLLYKDKYDYSNIKSIEHNRICVPVKCSKHGMFSKRVDLLLCGSGCPCCAKESTAFEKAYFLRKAEIIHKSKYDYSKVNHISNRMPVTIICKEHGEFEQTPENHMSGYGCPVCGQQTPYRQNRKSTKQFISEARRVHGNKYDYSSTLYTSSRNPVLIKCTEHGEFIIRADAHVTRGHGCPPCGIVAKFKKTVKNDFLEKAKRIHGDVYDYSHVKYIKRDVRVVIICKKHGAFEQMPYVHLRGAHCLKCVRENMRDRKKQRHH